MEQIARRKKTKIKRQEAKEIILRPKRKTRKSTFENDVAKFGMNKISKVTNVTENNNKAISATNRLTVKYGMFANSMRSKIVSKNKTDFDVKIAKDEEFNARINCDLNKIMDLSKKHSSSTVTNSMKNEIAHNSHKNGTSTKKNIDITPIIGQSNAKKTAPTSTLTRDWKEKPSSSKVSFYRKISNESKTDTENDLNHLIMNSIRSQTPICTTHSYIDPHSHKNPSQDNEHILSTLHSDLRSRFHYYCDGFTKIADTQRSKLKINVLNDLRCKLKKLHMKYQQNGNKDTNVVFNEIDMESRKKHSATSSYELQSNTVKNATTFNFHFNMERNENVNELNKLSNSKTSKDYFIADDNLLFKDSFPEVPYYKHTAVDFSPDIEDIKYSKKSRYNSDLETPEFHYQKMNL